MCRKIYLLASFILVLILGGNVAIAGLWDGVLVRYEFDDPSPIKILDSSGNGYHGVEVGEVTVVGGVLALDGSNFVDIPLGADNPFDGATSFTVAMAVRPTVAPILFSSSTDQATDGAFSWYAIEESATEADIYHDVVMIGWLGTGTVPLLDGEWHYVAITYDAGTGYHTIYFDGEETVGWAEPANQTFTWLAPSPETYTNRIGGTLNDDTLSMGSNFFEGDIDYFYIFTRVLSAKEIPQLIELKIQASNETPEDGTENVRTDTNLCFKPPESALVMDPLAEPNFKGPFMFDVYFGSDEGSLAWIPPTIGPVDSNDEICVDPCAGKLQPGTPYY